MQLVRVKIYPEGTTFASPSSSDVANGDDNNNPRPYDVMEMDEEILKACSPVIQKAMSKEWANNRTNDSQDIFRELRLCYSPPCALQKMLSCACAASSVESNKRAKRDAAAAGGSTRDWGKNFVHMDVDPAAKLEFQDLEEMARVCVFYQSEYTICFLANVVTKQCDKMIDDLRRGEQGKIVPSGSWACKACEFVLPRVALLESMRLLPKSFMWNKDILSILNWGHVTFVLEQHISGSYSFIEEVYSKCKDQYTKQLLPAMHKKRLVEMMCCTGLMKRTIYFIKGGTTKTADPYLSSSGSEEEEEDEEDIMDDDDDNTDDEE